ncbi:hypothetical protein D030_4194B, partial [Vibrio parahaemolyticus AQ3810]
VVVESFKVLPFGIH